MKEQDFNDFLEDTFSEIPLNTPKKDNSGDDYLAEDMKEPEITNICGFKYCDNHSQGRFCSSVCELEEIIARKVIPTSFQFKTEIERYNKLTNNNVLEVFQSYIEYRDKMISVGGNTGSFGEFLTKKGFGVEKKVIKKESTTSKLGILSDDFLESMITALDFYIQQPNTEDKYEKYLEELKKWKAS